MPKLSEAELKAICAAEKAASLSAVTANTLTNERKEALSYYNGDVSTDVPSLVGRSTAVSSDVFDTIEGLMPSLMEIFAGSDDAVRFEPVGPEDIDPADQATEYIKHTFWNRNDGYAVLYAMIKDALLEKLGIVKVHWYTETNVNEETYYDQTDMQLAMILSDKDVEPVEHTAKPDPITGEVLHDVKVQQKKTIAYAKCEAVPPEEFGIAKRARNRADCPYCFHEVISTENDLIADGYDADMVKGLPSYGNLARNQEILARDTVEDSSVRGDTTVNKAMRPIRLTEHYIKMDYEQRGKGEAQLYQVVTGGEDGIVLHRNGKVAVTEWDTMPFAWITPIINPHRVFGLSVADAVMDIQRIKTVLMRGLLDNTYAANMPRPVVASTFASDNTLDDLAVFRHGAPIRVKQPGAIEWQQVPSVINHLFPILQYMDSLREWRTGVSRQGQGLDADALNNQTATAAMQLFNVAQARMKLIARTFAETGVKDLFWLLHETILKHKNQADIIRLTNKWVPVDPRNWKTRNDITVSVGLGQGGKAERMMQMQQIQNMQQLAVQAGLVELVTPKNLFNSAKEVCKIIEQDVELFFQDPGDQAKLNPKQPPEMIKAQTEMQKIQMDSSLRQQEMQGRADIEKLQAQADVASQDRKVQSEIALAQQKMQFEMALEQQRFEMERELKMYELAGKQQEHQMATHQAVMDAASAEHQHELDIEKAALGVNTNAQNAAIQQQGAAQKNQFAADDHARKMKEQGAPLSNAIKKLQDNSVEHGKTLQDILAAMNEDREITLTRDAKGKAAGAVSRRKKNGGVAKS